MRSVLFPENSLSHLTKGIDWREVQMHFRHPQFMVSRVLDVLGTAGSCWPNEREQADGKVFFRRMHSQRVCVCLVGGV